MMEDSLLHINWDDFHFLRPQLLWLLIPVLILLIIGLLGLRESIKWKHVIAPHLRPFMIQKGSDQIKKWMHIGLFAVLSIAILGSAGPTWRQIELPEKVLETPFVILLDLSQSMMATDIQPSRLERAKFKITDLLEAKPGANIALIAYAGSAHTVVPLTKDYNIIKSHVKSLSPNIMPIPGSDLQAALALGRTIISKTTAPGTTLIVSDDFTENSFNMIQEFALDPKNNVVIMPVNTTNGATIPSNKRNTKVRDARGEIVTSSLNINIINKLASVENINISALTLDKSDMQLLAKNISKNLQFKEAIEEKENNWKDEGLWLVLPLALFLLFWFRKGWVLYSFLILVTFSSCNKESKFTDLWLTKDYQAQQAYNRDAYQEAAELYSDPLHEGVAWYKNGDYEKAIEAFKKDSTAIGAYNLGLSYYKNGDYEAAELAFGKASELDPEFEEADNNKALMNQLITEIDPASAEEAEEAPPNQKKAQNIENKDSEDLGGGGQEATDEDMKKERKEETVGTDMRTGKEMDEVPPDFESGNSENSQKVLMRKVDDDPALFLKRKFKHQAKTQKLKARNKEITW